MTSIDTTPDELIKDENEGQRLLYAWIRDRHGPMSDTKAEEIWQEVEIPRMAEEEFGSQEAADAYYVEMDRVKQEQLAEIREVEQRSMGL